MERGVVSIAVASKAAAPPVGVSVGVVLGVKEAAGESSSDGEFETRLSELETAPAPPVGVSASG